MAAPARRAAVAASASDIWRTSASLTPQPAGIGFRPVLALGAAARMAANGERQERRRPRQARSRATWEAIVEAASQILERRGPDALNTNAIAERAGVSIGTLYQYFA